MFSELCRETLRKAAVCYSSGRSSGSSPSPSPPTSPPPSPSKSPSVNESSSSSSRSSSQHQQQHHYHHVETREIGCTGRTLSVDHHYQLESGYLVRRSTSPTEFREKRVATPTNVSSRRTSGLDTRDGRRPPYAATAYQDASYNHSAYREQQQQQQQQYYYHQYQPTRQQQYRYQCHRRGRSASPEMLRSISLDERGYRGSCSSPEFDDNSSTSGDEAGATSDENSHRPGSAQNRHSLTKGLRRRSYQFDEDSLDGDHPYEHEGRDSSGGGVVGGGSNNNATTTSTTTTTNKDLDRARLVRERQNEERQRKLEELRQQALAAQRFREQREEERRRRIEELRSRDNDRRSQVEERKRQIWEAERERREAIMRKNQEREARIEAKRKNERSHIVFAFGSSTPRMLEPADTGGATASFWGTRRATSTSNVMMFSSTSGAVTAQPLTRRSSERELDAGSKKRATSAGGLDRKPGEDMRMSSSMYEVFNWNDTPDTTPLTPAKSKRASLSFPHTTDIFSIDDSSPMTQRGAIGGDDNEATTPTSSSSPMAAAGCVTRYANRRRTDLMPTIPSPRDRDGRDRDSSSCSSSVIGGSSSNNNNNVPGSGRSSSAKSFTRSPGRTYSMSRLDQLAQPRRRPTATQAQIEANKQLHLQLLMTPPEMLNSKQHLRYRQRQRQLQSLSRSMSHLTAVHALNHHHYHHRALSPASNNNNNNNNGPLKRTDNSRSMGTLPGSGLGASAVGHHHHHHHLVATGPLRPGTTRAERLRRKAREHQTNGNNATNQLMIQSYPGIRSGEVTPSSPSRPHSSMSQQSGTSSVASITSGGGGGGVAMRPRTAGTPRRPRPASIAGTGVTTSSFDRSNNSPSEARGQKDAKPPLPKVHSSTPKSAKSTGTASPGQISAAMSRSVTLERKQSAGGGSRSGRPSPRVTPKPTPLQSPGIEQLPPPQLELANANVVSSNSSNNNNNNNNNEIKQQQQHNNKSSEEEKPKVEDNTAQLIDVSTAVTESTANETKKPADTTLPLAPEAIPASTTAVPSATAPNPTEESIATQKDEPKPEKKSSPEPEAKLDADMEEQCDMTASMIQKIRITTEEEAKAALAERRRLAREQAEREAELERQRLEELERQEAERLRAEEEEQRRLEEETLRLAQEAREAEEQRLKQAIEEAEKREEEDRKRREEEARQKAEKEEAERKAKIEAEKQRLEMEQRLKKEEEERIARRKRVEAIMSRTRKSQANAQKGEGNDGEKSKEDSPSDESKPGPGDKSSSQDLMTTSLITEATQQFISIEQRAHSNSTSPVNEQPNNGHLLLHSNGTSNGIENNSSGKSLLDNDNSAAQQQQQQQQQEFNGLHNNSTSHGNGIDGQTIALDNATVKQNNVTNNLLDLSDFDELSNSNSVPILLMQQQQQQQQQPNEDSINSNLNPTAIPFMPNFGNVNANPFQDTFASNKQQQDNQVTDLLS